MNKYNILLNISSEALSQNKNLSDIPEELQRLYRDKNGFQVFEGSLRILPCDNNFFRNVITTNSFIKDYLDKEFYYFADNILGDAFCFHNGKFLKYDFESGEFDSMGSSLETFAETLLSDYNFYTGYSLAKEWQTYYGEIMFDEMLIPKIPFILGGEYKVANLEKSTVLNGLKKKINLYRNLKELCDGEKVQLNKVYF